MNGGVFKMGLVGGLLGIMVAVLIGVSVVMPTVSDAITDANFTGTTATILGVATVLIATVLIVSIASLIRG